MTTIAEGVENLKRAVESGRLKPAPPVPPTAYPTPELAPMLNPLLRAPMPPSSGLHTDAARQFHHHSIPQTRIWPLPPMSEPRVGAPAQSAATQAVNTVLPGVTPAGSSQLNPATLDNVGDGAVFGRVTQTALTNNLIDPSKPGVLSIGSRPQSIASAITFTTTTTSITLYWDGTNGSTTLSVFRDDGTIAGPFSANQTITGLTANTKYFVYPYFNETNNTVIFASVAGAVGSPAYCYTAANLNAAQLQILRQHIPLALTLATTGFTTPASGTGSGSGGSGGGGGGGCFTGSVGVRTPSGIIPFDQFPEHELFPIENLTGVHKATLVVHRNYSDWMIELGDPGDGKLVTAGHGMRQGNNYVPAIDYYKNYVPTLDYHRVTPHFETNLTVYNLHVVSDNPEDHHYVIETGDVAHNYNKQ